MIPFTEPGSSWTVLALPDNQVHLWHAGLDVESAELNRLEATLSSDERARASRFYFEKDRQCFVARRGILRQILSRYLGCEAREMEFGYGPYGKPFLTSISGEAELRFNLAHSHGMTLFGIARNREIGVDLERVDQSFAYHQIAERFFSRRECSMLRNLPYSQHEEAFFNCWTRKEAYVKAHGAGLQMPLDSFDVSLIPGLPPELLNSGNETWVMRAPKLGRGYCAAVVVEGNDCDHKTFEWKATAARTNENPDGFYTCNTGVSVTRIQVE
jgi:4'-phosphopantetheinyl transferase